MTSEIVITDEFANDRGEFPNYDSYNPLFKTALDNQRHVDLRSFLSREAWTNGTITKNVDRNYWNSLSIDLSSGVTSSTSVQPAIDLSADFLPTDYLSLSIVSLPASVDLSASFIDLTSDPSGIFADGSVASAALSESSSALTPGSGGEGRWPLSSFATIDLAKVTGVQFRISSSATGTLRLLALRLLGADWQRASIDLNTQTQRLRRPPTTDGAPDNTPPVQFGTVFRSGILSGLNDPRPIDSEIAVVFNTGTITGGGNFSIYLREVPWDLLSQVELDGRTQTQLDNFHTDIRVNGSPTDYLAGWRQPEIDAALYRERSQTELETFDQSELRAFTQRELEITGDDTSTSFIKFQLTWNAGSTNLKIVDQDNRGFTTTPLTLASGKNYLFIASLDGTEAQARLYGLSTLDGLPQSTLDTMTQAQLTAYGGSTETLAPDLVYDTGVLNDTDVYKRRKGRVGWNISFEDGDAFVDSLRTRKLNFAEFQTKVLNSITPVDGAELFAGQSPPLELFSGFSPKGTLVGRDKDRSTSGESFKIEDNGSIDDSGLISNLMPITNFDETEIEFKLYYPSGPDATIEAYLVSAHGLNVPLITPRLAKDQWQHIVVSTDFGGRIQTGTYALKLVQSKAARAIWWVDSISVRERTIRWEGRATLADAWSAPPPWTPFRNLVNVQNGGVLFSTRGTQLQIRAKALRQSGSISGPIKVVPKYSQLGRILPSS